MRITAVIVNYHTASIVPPLLNDLFANACVADVLLVDNSGDVPSGISSAYPKLHVVRNKENRGFGAAVNQAARMATGEWLLVINPDIRLCEGCLESLVNVGMEYDCPIVGPRFYWDEHLQFKLPPATGGCLWFHAANKAAANFQLDREILSFYWTLRHQRFWEAKEPFFEPFLSGACLLISMEWITSMGGEVFDERFFLYFEDTDLCVKAMNRGVRPLCVPQASVIHFWDQAPSPENNKMDLMGKAQEQFEWKYYGAMRFPSAKGAAHALVLSDLGNVKTPPEFVIEREAVEEPFFFEIAMNGYFVPFAQAVFETSKFVFPSEIWSRLGRGTYYCRVRGAVSGSLGMWKWKK